MLSDAFSGAWVKYYQGPEAFSDGCKLLGGAIANIGIPFESPGPCMHVGQYLAIHDLKQATTWCEADNERGLRQRKGKVETAVEPLKKSIIGARM